MHGGTTITKKLVLLAWIAAIIFPFGWLTLYSRQYSAIFNWLFATNESHIFMHAAIFGGLAVLLAATLFQPGARLTLTSLFWLWLLVGVIAASQELFQLAFKARQSGADEYFDIATDLTGALLGLLALQFWWRRPSRR